MSRGELKLRLNLSPRMHPQCFSAVRFGDSDVLVSTGTSLTLTAAEPLKAKSPPVKPTSAQRHLVISAVPESSRVTHKSFETAMRTSKRGSWRTSCCSTCTKDRYKGRWRGSDAEQWDHWLHKLKTGMLSGALFNIALPRLLLWQFLKNRDFC